jgi:hypothetical protein
MPSSCQVERSHTPVDASLALRVFAICRPPALPPPPPTPRLAIAQATWPCHAPGPPPAWAFSCSASALSLPSLTSPPSACSGALAGACMPYCGRGSGAAPSIPVFKCAGHSSAAARCQGEIGWIEGNACATVCIHRRFVYGANSPERQALFQTGWFNVGLLTQTLIVHMIRTERIPFLQEASHCSCLGCGRCGSCLHAGNVHNGVPRACRLQ